MAALREASLTRLRPVLMTSAATVFGHFPLVLVQRAGRRGAQQHRHRAGRGHDRRHAVHAVRRAGLLLADRAPSTAPSERAPRRARAATAARAAAPATGGRMRRGRTSPRLRSCRSSLARGAALFARRPARPSDPTTSRPRRRCPPPGARTPARARARRGRARAAGGGDFEDPVLDELVERAARQGLDLREALARVREARALRGDRRGRALPDGRRRAPPTSAAARARTRRFGGFVPDSDMYSAGFDAAWELDLWGRVRRSVEAADADLAASVEDARDVAVTVAAETARQLRRAARLPAARRDRAQRTSRCRSRRWTLVRARFEAGLVGERDVAQARANVETHALARAGARGRAARRGEPPGGAARAGARRAGGRARRDAADPRAAGGGRGRRARRPAAPARRRAPRRARARRRDRAHRRGRGRSLPAARARRQASASPRRSRPTCSRATAASSASARRCAGTCSTAAGCAEASRRRTRAPSRRSCAGSAPC